MSGQRKRNTPKDLDATFGAPPAPVITAPEEAAPIPPARVIVHCKDCFWGSDVSIGQRRCRGSTPTPFYKQVTGFNGDIMATPMWAVVRDLDWCAKGEAK